jgi:hypothetical protein
MDLQPISLDFKEVCGFEKFHFHPIIHRRNLKVEEVLPSNAGFAFCAIITKLEIVEKNEEVSLIKDFEQLFSHQDLGQSWENLQVIRRKNRLIENTFVLDSGITQHLQQCAEKSNNVFVRCQREPSDKYLWKIPLLDYLHSEDLIEDLPYPFGVFEVIDEGSNWYIRMRDDDPFLFLAGPKSFVSQIARSYPQWILQIPGHMLY